MTDRVIRLHGLVNGEPTPFDNQFVVEYDPSRNGVTLGNRADWPVPCHLVTTPDISCATRFSAIQATQLYGAVDERTPVRPDGRPNRPLTAFTVEFEAAP